MHVQLDSGYVVLKSNSKPILVDIDGMCYLHAARFEAAAGVDSLLEAKLQEGINKRTLHASQLGKQVRDDLRQSLNLFSAVKTHIDTSPPLLEDNEAACPICDKESKTICIDAQLELRAHLP